MPCRARLLLASVALSGCVDLSRPASLAQVDVVDAGALDGSTPDGPDVDGPGAPDAAPSSDGDGWEDGPPDAPAPDAHAPDAPLSDAALPDAVTSGPEAGPPDAAPDVAPDTGGCTSEAQCESGYSCIAQMCGPLPGLALHWKLDETSGTQAADDSGNGFHGTYGGDTGAPATSTSVPTLQFPDPASRSFVGANHQEARLPSLPAILRRDNDVTLSAWFRATQVYDSSGYAEIVSIGDGYVLYIGRTTVGLVKRLVDRDYVFCTSTISGHLDGGWHHLAGSTTTSGMKLYFDGDEVCSNSEGRSVTYSATPAVLVGRDPDPSYGWYFDGSIDDVRAYSRTLSGAEVMKLAAGAR